MWLRPMSILAAARNRLIDRCSIAKEKKKKAIIAEADRWLINNVPNQRENKIAVLWESGFCDYLFMPPLLSLR